MEQASIPENKPKVKTSVSINPGDGSASFSVDEASVGDTLLLMFAVMAWFSTNVVVGLWAFFFFRKKYHTS
jgi:hypothetical protein